MKRELTNVPPFDCDQVEIVNELCRKYNKTAMSLLETRSFTQALSLMQKAQVHVCVFVCVCVSVCVC